MPDSAVFCRHFGTCGGCSLQDLPDEVYRLRKRARIEAALARFGVKAIVEPLIEVAPASRRRAVFKVKRAADQVSVGFHAAGSHAIVDMQECRVLTPALFGLAAGIRAMMAALLPVGATAEAHVTEADNGFDVGLRWQVRSTPTIIANLAAWAQRLGLVRIVAGSEVLVALDPPVVRLGQISVALPPDAFLQPTHEGEQVLQQRVGEILANAKSVADLFSGCGTFALPLARTVRVHAVERDGAMLDALAGAARQAGGLKPVTIEKRDLFRRPLLATELARFDGVVLDPPGAGAEQQVGELARSNVKRIAYVSCDADTFARDAYTLAQAGYSIDGILPVDQFLWSEHIELVAAFRRSRR